MNSMEELVFAFPTDQLWKLIPYTEKGLIKNNGEVLKRIVQEGLFRKRGELEEDHLFKQIIPYGVISNKESYYLVKRSPGQTEKRLLNLYSLGVGGHMNPGNPGESEELYLINELKRELFEEVRFSKGCVIENIEFIGFINDDTIQVGKFHVGLLYNIEVSNTDVIINEPDKMSGGWVDKSSLGEYYEGMETWSKMTYDLYISNL